MVTSAAPIPMPAAAPADSPPCTGADVLEGVLVGVEDVLDADDVSLSALASKPGMSEL